MDNLNDTDYLDRDIQQIFLWPRRVGDCWYQASDELKMVAHPGYRLPDISRRQKTLDDHE
jgi:hypothetical protein